MWLADLCADSPKSSLRMSSRAEPDVRARRPPVSAPHWALLSLVRPSLAANRTLRSRAAAGITAHIAPVVILSWRQAGSKTAAPSQTNSHCCDRNDCWKSARRRLRAFHQSGAWHGRICAFTPATQSSPSIRRDRQLAVTGTAATSTCPKEFLDADDVLPRRRPTNAAVT